MKQKKWFLAGILFQLVAIFGLFIPYILLSQGGMTATLKTIPVDPRSVFRGDYVILGYEAGQDLPRELEERTTIYVVLESNEEDIYERVSYSEEKPSLNEGQICLRGSMRFGTAAFPDIAQFFVEEGTGHSYEEARNMHRLFVNITVNDDCRAMINGLVLGPEVPEEELRMMTPERIPMMRN